MTLRSRRFLFYTLICLFFLLGSGVVFYAQGWRVDWPHLSLQKVGAIYVRSWPGDATIYLNDKVVNRPFRFFETGVLINDLFPKSYTLRLERSGFAPWHRSLIVKPSFVTEAKHAVLVPQDATSISTTTMSDFWLIDQKLLLRTQTGTLLWRDQPIPGDAVRGWTNDGNRLLLERAGRPFWVDLTIVSSTDLTARLRTHGFALQKSTTITVIPQNSARLIVRSPHALMLFDLENDTLTPIATTTQAEEITFAEPYQNLVLWSHQNEREATTHVSVSSIIGQTISQITLPGRTRQLVWASNGARAGILQDTGALYLYENGSGKIRDLANDVKSFTFDQGGLRLAAAEQRSLEIFSLRTDDYWRFNLPEIEQLTWYMDGYHLFLQYPDHVAFLDLDDWGLEDVQAIPASAKHMYDERTNTLYILRDGKLATLLFFPQ